MKIPPPSPKPERAKVAEFYSARSATITPLPWLLLGVAEGRIGVVIPEPGQPEPEVFEPGLLPC